MNPFSSRYGPWAVVAGASEGLGAEFAKQLAESGVNLLLIARQAELLSGVAEDIRCRHGVEVRCLVQDLADTGLARILQEATADLEVGIIVYNAAYVPTGQFTEMNPDSLEQLVRVNVQGPVTTVRALVPAMCERGRGAVVLVSSLAGMQGSPGGCRVRGQQSVQHHPGGRALGRTRRAEYRRGRVVRRCDADARLPAHLQYGCTRDVGSCGCGETDAPGTGPGPAFHSGRDQPDGSIPHDSPTSPKGCYPGHWPIDSAPAVIEHLLGFFAPWGLFGLILGASGLSAGPSGRRLRPG